MSHILADHSETAPYELPDLLRSPSEEVAVAEYTEPGEFIRDQLLLEKLGERVWGRFHYFRQVFSGPWGRSGEGRPLSPRAVEAFFSFLEDVAIPADRKPSLFLTDDGHLELCWEDAEGKAVQLEFGPNETEIYFESDETEQMVANSRLPEVVSRVSGR